MSYASLSKKKNCSNNSLTRIVWWKGKCSLKQLLITIAVSRFLYLLRNKTVYDVNWSHIVIFVLATEIHNSQNASLKSKSVVNVFASTKENTSLKLQGISCPCPDWLDLTESNTFSGGYSERKHRTKIEFQKILNQHKYAQLEDQLNWFKQSIYPVLLTKWQTPK